MHGPTNIGASGGNGVERREFVGALATSSSER